MLTKTTITGINVLFSCGILIFQDIAVAQIVPDTTLPNNSRVFNQDNINLIEGGTQAGENLFHSFEQFSIPTGGTAYFNNAVNVQNIISRVTGSSISNIEGLIKANSTANLFLINPNGIFFGSNASLNIGGSFLASTASSLNLADRTKFSAKAPQNTPLLTVNVPVGLDFGSSPGEIFVQGIGHTLSFANSTAPVGSPIVGGSQSLTGLKTAPGKTLALIGGQVKVNGGVLTAPSGEIEIGSVSEGIVDLTLTPRGFSFNYNNISGFQDIQLSRKALLDASGFFNGKINIRGRNLYLNDGSLILISSFGDLPSSKIDINTAESLVITGVTNPANFSPSNEVIRGIATQNFSTAKGADIFVNSKNVILQNFSTVGTFTFGEGRGGNVTINVQDDLKISGYPPINFLFLPSMISASTYSSGQAGSLQMSGKNLYIQDGGLILLQTGNFGKGGNILAKFSEGIEITGGFPIDLTSDSFIPSTLGTIALSSGDAGDIFINTRQLNIKNGGRISSATAASGKGGNITISANDLVEVEGRIPGSVSNKLYNFSQIIASATQNNYFLFSLLNLPSIPEGEAGSIIINKLSRL